MPFRRRREGERKDTPKDAAHDPKLKSPRRTMRENGEREEGGEGPLDNSLT